MPKRKTLTVGKVREQCARQSNNAPVCIKVLTKKGEYWADLEAVDCYPDTIGPDGKWNSTFVLVLKEKTDG